MIFAVFVPLLFASLVPLLNKLKSKVHTGIFVFFIPSLIFLYFIQFIENNFEPIRHTYQWIPSLSINIDFYLVWLSLLFVLLLIISVLFIFFIPSQIFLYFIQFIENNFEPIRHTYQWIPSLSINIDFYLDGLSLLFVLLISGIGSLVVLYSIYYLGKSERLGHFYVYLLMFMTAMLSVVLSN